MYDGVTIVDPGAGHSVGDVGRHADSRNRFQVSKLDGGSGYNYHRLIRIETIPHDHEPHANTLVSPEVWRQRLTYPI